MDKISLPRVAGAFALVLSSLFSFGQNGYFQNFNAGTVPSQFTAESSYSLSNVNNTLELRILKANVFHAASVTFPTAINLSVAARRKVSFRIRTDTTTWKLPFDLDLAMFNAGATNQNGGAGTRTSKKIHPTTNWQTISYDFNDPAFTSGGSPLNFSAVTQLNFIFQNGAYMVGNAKIYIDDIAVGDNGNFGEAAVAAPYFRGIPNQQVTANSSGFIYKIRNAVDADNLNQNITFTATSSNPTILPNPTFTNSPFLSNNFFAFTSGNGSGGNLPSSRLVNMSLVPAANQFGMVTVTVTATTTTTIAGVTLQPYRYVFSVDVRRNNPPVIGTIPTSLVIGSDRTTDIFLDNINSGNGEAAQIMSITGISSDQTVMQNSQIVTSFNGIGLTAKMSITPIQFASPSSKIFNLTVNISDNGGIALGASNRTSYIIPVTVVPVFYSPPTINIIPNQVDNIITQGPRTIRIEGITDGNGGSRITSVVALSGNTGIVANPTVSYTPGNNFALLTYNSLVVGSTVISVTATNFGAPANSNGNSSFTRVFTMVALNPPLSGYIEPMTVQTIVGPNNADGRSSTVSGTWYVESQGNNQTVSINTATGVFTNVMTKAGTAVGGYFSGVWYKPAGGGDLYNFKSFPYLSVRLSTNNTAGRVAIDLWDVNGIRYGLSSELAITGTPTTYTFCYTGTPSVGFDFSKIKVVLFNFGVTDYNGGTGSWAPYNGTVTMSDLRIGNQALGSGSCSLPLSRVNIGTSPNPYHLTTQAGNKTITISGINAGSTPISGNNNNPVNLVVTGAFSPTILSFSTLTGTAVIQYTTGGAQTGAISLTGSAVASNPTSIVINVNVQAPPGATNNVVVTNDLNAAMADGQRGQTIDGSPFGICEIFAEEAANLPATYYEMLKENKIEAMRIGIWDFEPTNDNNDPFVLDKTKLDYDAMQVEFFKKASDAGVKRFFATFFSPPSFVKYNNTYGVPNAPFTLSPGFIITNTVDSAYYEEYAEYAVAFVQGVKEKSGVDIYGLSIGNEIQFNQTYQSVVLNTTQYVEIVRRVGRRLAAAGLKVFIWGAETLQAQDDGNDYLKAVQNDLETRNYFGGYAIHAYAANGVGQAAPSWGNVVIDSRDTRSNGGLALLRQSPIATVGPGGEQHNGNGGTGIPIYQTETSQSEVANVASWDNAMGVFAAISTSLNVGNNSGWYYIGITREYKMFYTYKHVDKFVFDGARRIPATQPSGTNVSAFRNPDNSVCIIMANDNTAMRTFSFGGTNMPSVFKAYYSVDNLYWQDLGTVTGTITLPPNAMLTLWGGGNALVAANGITISGANTTNIAGGTIQFSEFVAPATLVDKSVSWSIITQTGNAIINQTGLFTAVANGTVRVRATSNSTPSVFSELIVTISGQYVKVAGLTITGQGGNTISTFGGTKQILSTFSPATAPFTTVGYSLSPFGLASIDAFGLLTAIANGTVTILGTSLDNNTVTSRVAITITGQGGSVTAATISGLGGVNQITVANGTLQMTTTGLAPLGANQNTIPTWSISSATLGNAINASTGLLSSANNSNGVITVQAAFGSVLVYQSVTVSGQNIPLTAATISGVSGNQITIALATLQMTVTGLAPLGANQNTAVTAWSLLTPNLGNSINAGTGLLQSAVDGNGVVTVQASFGGTVFSTRVVTISGQGITATSMTINGANISVASGTTNISVVFGPVGANVNTTSGLSANIPGGIAGFSAGVLTANNNGNGLVTFTGSFGAIRIITITGQFVAIPLTAATISGVSGNQITTALATLQMSVTGLAPLGANQNTAVTAWSLLAPNLGNSINASGLLQSAVDGNGVVTVQASFGGTVFATRVVTISGQGITATSMTINGANISVASGTSNISVVFGPVGANVNTTSGLSANIPGGIAGFSAGVLTANNNGNGLVTFTGSFGAIRIITITGQFVAVPLTAATISGVSGNQITTALATLQMSVTGLAPLGANQNTAVTAWSLLVPNLGNSINSSGLLQSASNSNGVVTVQASFGGTVFSTRVVTISGQDIPLTAAVINGVSGNQILIANGTLQMSVTGITPINATTNLTPSWSIQSATLGNSINATTGLLSSATNSNGVITIQAAFGGVNAFRTVTISGQNIPVTAATISGVGGVNQITSAGGILQMTITGLAPLGANQNTTPTWSVLAPTLGNTIGLSGLLQSAINSNGTITVQANFGGVLANRIVVISGQNVPLVSATINGVGSNFISVNQGTLQMSVTGINPVNANQNTLPGWTLVGSPTQASINAFGLISANANATITVQAAFGAVLVTRTIVISNQLSALALASPSTVIGTNNGTLQITAVYTPAAASVAGVTYALSGSFGTISGSGLITALFDGVLTVTATSLQNPSLIAVRLISITGQIASVIQVTSAGLSFGNTIVNGGGNLTLTATVGPANASNPTINWSLNPASGVASIAGFTSTSITISPSGNGVITLNGISVSNPSITVSRVITVSGFPIPVTSTTVNGSGGINTISLANGTLQILAPFSPINANQNTVIGWSMVDPTSNNSLSASGLLTAGNNGNGIVTITGAYGAVISTRLVTISGQGITATSMTINGANISVASGTSNISVVFGPVGANVNTISGLSANIPGGIAGFGAGVLTANNSGNGLVTFTGSFGAVTIITISGQFVGIPLTASTISGVGGANQVSVSNGTLQMSVTGLAPLGANQNTAVTAWTLLVPNLGNSINSSGLLQSAVDGNGVVTVQASFGGIVFSTRVVTISGQGITATSMTINGANISAASGTSNVSVVFGPVGANVNTTSGLSANIPGGIANFSAGVLTANNSGNGLVTFTGSFGAVRIVTITGQFVGIPLTAATISGAGGVNQISSSGSTLQMSVTGLAPLGANQNTAVTAWSLLAPNLGNSINSSGLLQSAVDGNGVVTVQASFGGSVFSTRLVTISGQGITATSMTINGANISVASGTSNISVVFGPVGANVNTTSGLSANIPAGIASFNVGTGVLSANNSGNGLVTVTGSFGAVKIITITGQFVGIPLTAATISGAGGVNQISSSGSTLQMSVTGLAPLGANQNTAVTAWSLLLPNLGNSINSSGLLQSAVDGNGVVTVQASFGGTVFSRRVVTISDQGITATSITINGANISALGGTSPMAAVFGPFGANVGTVTSWVASPSSVAGINSGSGLLTAANNGLVTVTGTAGALVSTRIISVTGQFVGIPVVSATIIGAGGLSQINTAYGTLGMAVSAISPANANTNTLVGWSLIDPTGKNAIVNGNLISNKDGNGLVTVVGTFGLVKSYYVVTISGQEASVVSVSLSTSSNSIVNAGGSIGISTIFNPANATNRNMSFTIVTSTGGGRAFLSLGSDASSALLTALEQGDGTVTVFGTSLENSTIVSPPLVITITNQVYPIFGFTISTAGNTLTSDNAVDQIVVTYLPANTNQTNINYLLSSNGILAVDGTGKVLPFDNGVVTITAISISNPSLINNIVYTVTGQHIKTMTVLGVNITASGASTQMSIFTPQVNSPNDVIWSITGQKSTFLPITSGMASINSITGLLTSNNYSNGLITIVGFSATNSVTSTIVLQLSNQREPVIFVGASAGKDISTTGGSVQLQIPFVTSSAFDKSLAYSVISFAGLASVSGTGLLTATDGGNGIVTVRISSVSDPDRYSDTFVTITGQSTTMSITVFDQNKSINVQPLMSLGINTLNLIPSFDPPFAALLARNSFIQYTVNPVGIVTVDSIGTVNRVADGITTITCTYLNNTSLVRYVVFTVTSTNTDVKAENSSKLSFELSPVPASEVLYLNSGLELGKSNIVVYNASGAVVAQFATNSTLNFEMNIGQLASGLYNLVLNSKSGIVSKKFLIK